MVCSQVPLGAITYVPLSLIGQSRIPATYQGQHTSHLDMYYLLRQETLNKSENGRLTFACNQTMFLCVAGFLMYHRMITGSAPQAIGGAVQPAFIDCEEENPHKVFSTALARCAQHFGTIIESSPAIQAPSTAKRPRQDNVTVRNTVQQAA